MYRVLQITRKVLITTDEAHDKRPSGSKPDTAILNGSIEIAEERFIRPLMCSDFYDDFINQKNRVVDDTNRTTLEALFPVGTTLTNGQIVNAIELVSNQKYIDLWNTFLWKICAECVFYQASLTNYTRFEAQGQMINNPATITNEGKGSVSVDLQTMQWNLKKILEDRIDPLISAAGKWLYDNRGNYPLHNCKDWYKLDVSGTSINRKTAMIFAYGNTKTNCCYNARRNRFNDNYCSDE